MIVTVTASGAAVGLIAGFVGRAYLRKKLGWIERQMMHQARFFEIADAIIKSEDFSLEHKEWVVASAHLLRRKDIARRMLGHIFLGRLSKGKHKDGRLTKLVLSLAENERALFTELLSHLFFSLSLMGGIAGFLVRRIVLATMNGSDDVPATLITREFQQNHIQPHDGAMAVG